MLYHPAVPAVLGFLALLLILIPSWALLNNMRERERGVPGTATIVEKEERPFRGLFHIWVEFAGRRCRTVVPKETWKVIRPGESLAIRYDPERPGEVMLGQAAQSPKLILIFASVIALGLIVAAIAWRIYFNRDLTV